MKGKTPALAGSLLLAVVVAALLPFWRFIAGLDMFYLSDALHQHYPFQAVIGRILAESPSAIPRWNPFQFAGTPLAADPQTHVYYPPAIVYRLLPFPAANGCFLALHVLLAMTGMAAFLRFKGLEPAAAAIGALGYSIGAHPSSLLVVAPALAAYSWLPWVALTAARFAGAGRNQGDHGDRRSPRSPRLRFASFAGTRDRTARVREAVGLGLMFAMLLLAGSPAYVVYGTTLALIVTLVPGGKRAGSWTGVVAGVATVLGVAFAASAALAVPFAGYLPETGRIARMPVENANAGAMPIWHLVGLVAPHMVYSVGNGTVLGASSLWTSLHYAGTLTAALAFTAFAVLRGSAVLNAPAALVLTGVALGMGAWLPGAGSMILVLPPFSWMRHPGLWMALGGFGIAWLAALTADAILRRSSAALALRIAGWWAVTAVFLGAISVGAHMWQFGVLKQWLVQRGGLLAFVLAARLETLYYPATWTAVGALLLWLAARREITFRWALALIAFFVWADLLWIRNQLQPVARSPWLMEPSITEKFFARPADRGWFRVFVTPRHQEYTMEEGEGFEDAARNLKASMRSELTAASGLRDAGGSNPLKPARLYALLDRAIRAKSPGDPAATEVFRLLGVRYLITRGSLDAPGIRQVHSGHVKIYERAGKVGPVRIEPAEAGTVERAEGKPGEWVIEVKLTRPAVAVVSEDLLKGWKVAAGPKEARIEPAHGALIGVRLPAGEHRVRLIYDPWTIPAGLTLSLLGLAALLTAGFWGFYRLNSD